MADQRQPFGSDFVLGLPAVGAPSVRSTDGAVAYIHTAVDAETLETSSHIEMAPFEGGEARRLTAGPRDGAPRWSPDGSQLAFRRRAEEEGPSQLWLLPSDGGEATRLTDIPGGITDYAWAPDGQTIYCLSDVDPSHDEEDEGPDRPRTREARELYYRGDTIGWRGETRTHVFRVDVADGSHEQLTDGDFNHRSLAVSPDGESVAFVSDRSERRYLRAPWGGELCVMPAAGGRVRRLVWATGAAGGVAWSPDGREIAFVGMSDDNAWQHFVYLADADSGDCRRLTDDTVEPQAGFFPIAAAPAVAWHGDRIVFAADARGSSGIYSVDRDGDLRAERANEEILGALAASADGRRIAFVASTLDRPGEVTTLDLDGGESTVLTSSAEEYLAGHAIGRTERFTVEREGVEIECWLVFPTGFDESRRYPLVLEIHGGPNGFFGNGFSPLHQVIACAGSLVLYTNPRGSTTYGEAFTSAVFEDWGGEDARDLLAAVDVVCERPYVDVDRLGVHGYSYGGFMSSWLIGHDQRFRAAVIGAPVTNLLSMYGQTDIAASFGEQQWGGLPQDRLEHYLERSPLMYVDAIETPVLLQHGDADIRVPISQSEELFAALKRRGKTVEFIRYPDCSHLFLRVGHPSLRREYYDRVVEWFARWLVA